MSTGEKLPVRDAKVRPGVSWSSVVGVARRAVERVKEENDARVKREGREPKTDLSPQPSTKPTGKVPPQKGETKNGPDASEKRRRRPKQKSHTANQGNKQSALKNEGVDFDFDDDEDSGYDSDRVYNFTEFSVGMDIAVLLEQTLFNVVDYVCLDDIDGLGMFGDDEMTLFAAAVKYNSSIMSIQIRDLPVSDASLIELCLALSEHKSIRALEVLGTFGTHRTGTALSALACCNCGILHIAADKPLLSVKDGATIDLATQYNGLVCPDPSNNPLYIKLLRKISAIEEQELAFQEQLAAKPWLFGNGRAGVSRNRALDKSSFLSNPTTRSWLTNNEDSIDSLVNRPICAQYMNGVCSYGSRCRYRHPERSAPVREVMQAWRNEVERLAKEAEEAQAAAEAEAAAAAVAETDNIPDAAEDSPQFHDAEWRQRPANFALDLSRVGLA